MEIYKDRSDPASKEFEKLLNTQFTKTANLEEGKIITGTVNKVTNNFVFLEVPGLKSEPILDINELNNKKGDIELKTGKKINIVAVSAKNINKKRKFKINKNIFYKNPLEIFSSKKIDILFECIGLSDGISKKIVEKALKNKIHVITPNKALISKHGDYLSKLAEKNKVNLEFEASVAGGIPILRTIKEGLATNKINKVYGILNGTCNYILSEMESSKDSFINVLKRAQKLGYAEPGNPKLDLNGYDAFAKIRILSSLSFNKNISTFFINFDLTFKSPTAGKTFNFFLF